MYKTDLNLPKGCQVFRDNTASAAPVAMFYHGVYHTVVVAPATSNTVAKCVVGISDTLVTNVFAQAGKCRVPAIVFACDSAPEMETEAPEGMVKVYPRPIDLENTQAPGFVRGDPGGGDPGGTGSRHRRTPPGAVMRDVMVPLRRLPRVPWGHTTRWGMTRGRGPGGRRDRPRAFPDRPPRPAAAAAHPGGPGRNRVHLGHFRRRRAGRRADDRTDHPPPPAASRPGDPRDFPRPSGRRSRAVEQRIRRDVRTRAGRTG